MVSNKKINNANVWLLSKRLMKQYIENKTIKNGSKIWFWWDSISRYYYDFDMCMVNREHRTQSWEICGSFFFLEVENDVLLRTSTSKIFTSTKLSTEFSKIGIYATGTIRTKGKHANFNTKSANKTWRTWLAFHKWPFITKWIDNKSAMLLTKYFNSKATQQIDRRVKESK